MPDVIPMAKPEIGDEEIAALLSVVKSGNLTQGHQVSAFEDEFRSFCAPERTCVAVNSGTSALHLALMSLGVGFGDEVLVPSFTFAATANAVALTGATPIFADISLDSYCLSPEDLEAAITSRTRAIVAVHLYGHPAPMRELTQIARKNELLLLEDAAQAHGATIDDVMVGGWGDAAAFSFYATKNMTTGEGGMITFADPEPARIARLLRNQGQERPYENEIVGFNYRMTELQASLGRTQLKKLPDFNRRRQKIAAEYSTSFVGVQMPQVASGVTHVFHQYTIRLERRDAMREHLAARGITTSVYYPSPVHELPSFAAGVRLPNTEEASRHCLSVPIYPGLDQESVDRIIDGINCFTN